MKKLLFYFISLLMSFQINAQDITGDWYGKLKVPGMELPLVFHVSEAKNELKATMDSPAQGAFGIPVSAVSFKDSIFKVEVNNALIVYEGKFNNQSIEGIFKQGGASFPLTLTRENAEATQILRPQEPKEPFPYYTQDVVFENEEAGIKLAGTLSLPSKSGKFPVVVLISGSGPQNRNEELLNHKPFLVISHYLTQQGIGVLRFDDRGVAESEGDFSAASTQDFVTDAAAAVSFLKSQKQIKKEQIGLIGHSEGGLVASLLAAKSKDISFLVLLAAPGLRGDENLALQRQELEKAKGINTLATLQRNAVFKQVYNVILDTSLTKPQIQKEVFATFKENWGNMVGEEKLQEITLQHTTPWFINYIRLNPAEALEQLTIPVLAMNGNKDLQVPSEENLKAIEAALQKAGNDDFRIKEFENLNHLFQESETGLPNEYGEIEETFSPKALELMGNWILKQV